MSYKDPEKFRAYFRAWSDGNLKYRFQVITKNDRLRLERALVAREKARVRYRKAIRRVRTARQRIRRRPGMFAEELRRRANGGGRVLSMTANAIQKRERRRLAREGAA